MLLNPLIKVFQSNQLVMLTSPKVFKLIIEAQTLYELKRLKEAFNCLEEGLR